MKEHSLFSTKSAVTRLLALVFTSCVWWPAAAHIHSFSAGVPGDITKPVRIVEISATDEGGHMVFSPNRVDVIKGEQIRFIVHNAGVLSHEFFIGTRADNLEHAKMMVNMPNMKHNDPNAVKISAGTSASLVWRFTQAGTFEFACLIPGHYESGMHGVVNVK